MPHREQDSLCNQLKLQTFTRYNPVIDASLIPETDVLNFLRKKKIEKEGRKETKGKLIIRLQKNLFSNLLGVLVRE